MYDDLEEEAAALETGGQPSTKNEGTVAVFKGGGVDKNYFRDEDIVLDDRAKNLNLATIRTSDTRLPKQSIKERADTYATLSQSGKLQGGRSLKRLRGAEEAAPAFAPKLEARPDSYDYSLGFKYQKSTHEKNTGGGWNILNSENESPSQITGQGDQRPDGQSIHGAARRAIVPHAIEYGAGATNGRDNSSKLSRSHVNRHASSVRQSTEIASRRPANVVGANWGTRELNPYVESHFVGKDDIMSIPERERDSAILRANSEWASASTGSAFTVINVFGDQNSAEFSTTPDMRIREMNGDGKYKSKDLGQLKKRQRLGLIEKVEERDEEIRLANDWYHDIAEKAPEERGAAVKDLRRLMTIITGSSSSFFGIANEIKALPPVYMKRWNASRSARRHARLGRNTKSQDAGKLVVFKPGERSKPLITRGDGQRVERMVVWQVEELKALNDVEFPLPRELSTEEIQLREDMTTQSSETKRVVVVKLHELVKFNGEAIASRVFGGVVQQVQLMPKGRFAAVIFVHPAEAAAFILHVHNIRTKGSDQDKRALQVEAQWYGSARDEAVVPMQENLITYIAGEGATRALKLKHIHPTKPYQEVAKELAAALGKDITFMTIQTPLENHVLRRDGRMAIVEFASLADAIEAKHWLECKTVRGYDKCEPEYTRERSERQAPQKSYCDCMGCQEKRRDEQHVVMKRIEALRQERTSRAQITAPVSTVGSTHADVPVPLSPEVFRGASESDSDEDEGGESEAADPWGFTLLTENERQRSLGSQGGNVVASFRTTCA